MPRPTKPQVTCSKCEKRSTSHVSQLCKTCLTNQPKYRKRKTRYDQEKRQKTEQKELQAKIRTEQQSITKKRLQIIQVYLYRLGMIQQNETPKFKDLQKHLRDLLKRTDSPRSEVGNSMQAVMENFFKFISNHPLQPINQLAISPPENQSAQSLSIAVQTLSNAALTLSNAVRNSSESAAQALTIAAQSLHTAAQTLSLRSNPNESNSSTSSSNSSSITEQINLVSTNNFDHQVSNADVSLSTLMGQGSTSVPPSFVSPNVIGQNTSEVTIVPSKS
jgi:hypothetical protein